MTGPKYKGERPINAKCCKEIDQQHSKQLSLELEKKMQQKLMIVRNIPPLETGQCGANHRAQLRGQRLAIE